MNICFTFFVSGVVVEKAFGGERFKTWKYLLIDLHYG